MYQALYRKYRPTSFSDVVGQDHITSVLKTQLQKGKVFHAYMFCGSRGTGKTTCAKILAKAVNCENPINGEPCNQCSACTAINEERVLDVVEMDAASNNGVDHIRRLCDEVQFLPSEVKKRVYIIDEVHMLSTSAFNALLKTIEEPPAHVLFILATTEINDIPATIMSRCQRFDFKRITSEIITDRLMEISTKENIPLERDAAAIIARLSDGAMRDALSLLEACQGHSGTITADRIQGILGLCNRELVIDLLRSILLQDAKKCLSLVSSIYDKMSDFKEAIGDLISLYRDLLVIKTVPDYKDFIECYENELNSLIEISGKVTTEMVLYQIKELESFYISYDRISTGKKSSAEILMIRLCNESLSVSNEAILARLSKLESGAFVPSQNKTVVKSEPTEVKREEKAEKIEKENKAQTSNAKAKFEGSLKIKNLLQNIPYIKPWLGQIELDAEGEKLLVFASPFVKGLLLSSDAKDTILECARRFDPNFTDVQFLDEKKNTVQIVNDFEGL